MRERSSFFERVGSPGGAVPNLGRRTGDRKSSACYFILGVVVVAGLALGGRQPIQAQRAPKAQERAASTEDGDEANEAARDAVPLFEAMRAGQVAAIVKAHGFTGATLQVRNQTRRTLRVAIPAAFAAIPPGKRVATGGASRGGTGRYAYGGGHGSQTLGISAYRPSRGASASMAGEKKRAQAYLEKESTNRAIGKQIAPVVWELRPRGVRSRKFRSFCLELGLPDPSPRIPYRPIPLEQWTGNEAVLELIVRYGQGKIRQRAAQLAIWHLANGADWTHLAQVRWPNRARVTATELARGRAAAEAVLAATGARAEPRR